MTPLVWYSLFFQQSAQKLISAHFKVLHSWFMTYWYSTFDIYVSDNNHRCSLESTLRLLWNDYSWHCNQKCHHMIILCQRCSSPQTENDLWEAWNKTGHQGHKWNRAEIPLRKLRNFEVIFEGIRSRDMSGGAALDDLEFIDCAPSRWYEQHTHFIL